MKLSFSQPALPLFQQLLDFYLLTNLDDSSGQMEYLQKRMSLLTNMVTREIFSYRSHGQSVISILILQFQNRQNLNLYMVSRIY